MMMKNNKQLLLCCRFCERHDAAKFWRTMGASSDAVPNRCRLPAPDRHSGVSSVSARCNTGKFEVQLVEGGQEVSTVLLSVWPFVIYLYRNHAGCCSGRILRWNETTLWSASISANSEDHRACWEQGREDAKCSPQFVLFSAFVVIPVL